MNEWWCQTNQNKSYQILSQQNWEKSPFSKVESSVNSLSLENQVKSSNMQMQIFEVTSQVLTGEHFWSWSQVSSHWYWSAYEVNCESHGKTQFVDTVFVDTVFVDTVFVDTVFVDTVFVDTVFAHILPIAIQIFRFQRRRINWVRVSSVK